VSESGCTPTKGYGCDGYLPNHDYCDQIAIFPQCSDTFLFASVRDCPCFNLPSDPNNCQASCWETSNDCSPTLGLTLADLTPAAFMALGFPLSTGRVWALVYA